MNTKPQPESYFEALLAVRDGKLPRDPTNMLYMVTDKHAEISLLPRRWYNMYAKTSGIRVGRDRYSMKLLEAGKGILRALGEDDETS